MFIPTKSLTGTDVHLNFFCKLALFIDTEQMLLKIMLLEEESLKSSRILECIHSSAACQESGSNLPLLGSGLTLAECCVQSLQFKINVKKF